LVSGSNQNPSPVSGSNQKMFGRKEASSPS
jgi:hypothetical protein